jgi:hypothetical protein
MNNITKRILKSVYKTGYFYDFEYLNNLLSWRDASGRIFGFKMLNDKPFGVFQFGLVIPYRKYALTHESDYQTMEWISCVAYEREYITSTDNARFILSAITQILEYHFLTNNNQHHVTH